MSGQLYDPADLLQGKWPPLPQDRSGKHGQEKDICLLGRENNEPTKTYVRYNGMDYWHFFLCVRLSFVEEYNKLALSHNLNTS
jgi:hypothetical protein